MANDVQTIQARQDRIRIRIIKSSFLILVILLWEIGPTLSGSQLLPPFHSVMKALWTNSIHGDLLKNVRYSLYMIFTGITIGMILAFGLTALAMVSKTTEAILEVVISIMHPLPGIAMLPIVMLLFGLGTQAIIIIIVHSILWPLIVNSLAGFRSIPKIQIELGRNLGLKGVRLVWSVMVPNAFPYILSGIKIAWARSWRALVSAEMVFGAAGMVGGIGWYIYKTRYFMEIPSVFAGLVAVIIIGIIMDELILNLLEKNTVRKWGMSA